MTSRLILDALNTKAAKLEAETRTDTILAWPDGRAVGYRDGQAVMTNAIGARSYDSAARFPTVYDGNDHIAQPVRRDVAAKANAAEIRRMIAELESEAGA